MKLFPFFPSHGSWLIEGEGTVLAAVVKLPIHASFPQVVQIVCRKYIHCDKFSIESENNLLKANQFYYTIKRMVLSQGDRQT